MRYSLDPKENWKAVVQKQITDALDEWDGKESLIIPLPSLKYANWVDKIWLDTVNIDPAKGIFIPKDGFWSKIRRKLATLVKLFQGDHSQSWQPVCIFASNEIIKLGVPVHIQIAEHGPDASLFIAKEINNLYGLPWIVDFRDPIFLPYQNVVLSLMKTFYPYLLESANATINVNQPLAIYDSNVFKKESYCISNGFDSDEFLKKKTGKKLSEKICFFYPGQVYVPFQNIDPFFEFLSKIRSSSILFEFIYCGVSSDYVLERAKDYGLEDSCIIKSQINRIEILEYYSEVDFLVIIPMMEINSQFYSDGLIPGKFFEYLGSEIPIFCISKYNSMLERTIKKVGNGVVFDTPEKATEWLCDSKWKINIPQMNTEERKKFSRAHLTFELSNILDRYV
jgi:hypothetical protein